MANKIDDVKAAMDCAKIKEELTELISKYKWKFNTGNIRRYIQNDIKQYFDKFSYMGYELVNENGQPLHPKHFIDEYDKFCIPNEVHLTYKRP